MEKGIMQDLLKKYFGHDEFRPLQKEIIEDVIAGRDVFVLMPTGGGKSLCYQLPALIFDGMTLVVSPLISLMKDQVDFLKANGISAGFINSTLEPHEFYEIKQKILSNTMKLLYVAPERFPIADFQHLLSSVKVSLIAIDEAHCVSEWGHDFRPDYRNLRFLKTQFSGVPMIALTATATEKVREDVIGQLGLNEPKEYISSFDRGNLELVVERKKNSRSQLISLLRGCKNESAIIYCFSRRETEEIAADLNRRGFSALAYHGGLGSEERGLNQEKFIKDEVQVMVATIAFGMGIDKPDIRLIVHNTFPKSIEGYYQEIGRAGRDGLKSRCVLFYSYGDLNKHRYFIDDTQDDQLRATLERKVKQVIDYCEREVCRRKYILNYFGEQYENNNCGSCDVCLAQTETFDATKIVKMIFAAVRTTGSRFGVNYIVDVLRGSQQKNVLNNRHNELKIYGVAKTFSSDAIKNVLKSLMDSGYLKQAEGKYPTLFLSSNAAQWIKSGNNLELKRRKLKSESIEKYAQGRSGDGMPAFDQVLFEELRVLRKKLADEQGVPPFVIFGDVSLRGMCQYFPTERAGFLRIKGVGLKKLEDYGEIFMNVIRKYRGSDKDSPMGDQEKSPLVRPSHRLNDQYVKTAWLVEQKYTLDKIAEYHRFTQGTILTHIEKLLEVGENLDLNYLKPENGMYGSIEAVLKIKGDDYLKPIFEYLDGKFSYEDIRLARAIYHSQKQ